MIAPLAVLAVLSAALGWRGEKLGYFLGRTWSKILAIALIGSAMSFTIIPGDWVGLAINAVGWFVLAAVMALPSYVFWSTMRLLFRRTK